MDVLLWVWIIALVLTAVFITVPFVVIKAPSVSNPDSVTSGERLSAILFGLSGLTSLTFVVALIAWVVKFQGESSTPQYSAAQFGYY